MMNHKKISSFLMRKQRAEAELEMLKEEMEPYMDDVLWAIVKKRNMDEKHVKEMDKKGARINKLRTDLTFYEEQLLSSGLFDATESPIDEFPMQNFNLN